MGLDHWLWKKKFIWGDQRKKLKIEIDGKPVKGLDVSKVNEISQELISWRKENWLHKWFVDNVQDGEDDCREYSVSREQLIELRDTIRKVLKEPKLAEDLLPPQEGFFFGGTSMDEWYWHSVKSSEEVLTEVIEDKNNEDYDFYYSSSW
jgi:hypothetical protein